MESHKLEGKALITGASGFIGGRLRDALIDRGLDVVAIRRRGSPAAKRGRSVEAAYEDTAGLERLVAEERPDFVFHVAGATKGVSRDDFHRANVLPTKNLIGALQRAHPGVKRFVHVSTLAVYGPSAPGRPHVESSAKRPIEHYGETKLEAEAAVEAAKELPWTMVRPGGVYGPGDIDYFELFREVERGRNVFFGNKGRWFSAIYADDLVGALFAAATHPAAVGRGFFVCDNAPVTWERFQQAIVEASGRRVRTLNLPEAFVGLAAIGGEIATRIDGKARLFNRQKAKMGAQEAWTCKSDAIREALGWTHEYPLHRGVRAALDWYRKEGWFSR